MFHYSILNFISAHVCSLFLLFFSQMPLFLLMIYLLLRRLVLHQYFDSPTVKYITRSFFYLIQIHIHNKINLFNYTNYLSPICDKKWKEKLFTEFFLGNSNFKTGEWSNYVIYLMSRKIITLLFYIICIVIPESF